jgi:AGZA family xanthine/uracil permease-like MFS transporter
MRQKLFGEACTPGMIRREAMAGLTTFMTMAYIIFVQPAVLSGSMFNMSTGMDPGAVMVGTCLSAALATLVMGLVANYPIALAPGMGENFFFVLTVIPACAALNAAGAAPWQTALGVVYLSAIPFWLLTLVGLRRALMDALSPSLKNGVAAGIGLFIAFIGLQNGGLIVRSPGTLVQMNPAFLGPEVLIFLFGLFLTATLFARRVRGAILWGILGAAAAAILAGQTRMTFPVSAPPSVGPVFMQMDVAGVCRHFVSLLPLIVIFSFMDIFDTVGTLVGVAGQAGFIKDNRLPRADRAMMADGVGTSIGAILGTSTVTSYIESTTGVEYGGRTGLTACFVALFFLLALFFSPLVAVVTACKSVTAPALVIVGAMMMRSVLAIDWRDYSECVPAFLIMIGIPLTYSIADGLALGFVSYPLIKLCSGRIRETGWFTYVVGAALILYFVLVRGRIGA